MFLASGLQVISVDFVPSTQMTSPGGSVVVSPHLHRIYTTLQPSLNWCHSLDAFYQFKKSEDWVPVVGGIKGGMHKLEAKVRYRRGLCSGRRKEEPFGAIRGKNAHISNEKNSDNILSGD